ncbi:MAG: glycosyltransferase family 87 protein, partial [Candidatus Riflebacteria bacterium]|nr:glycosyltransferase family 87 protein [Candidatus Riflebacteria bacterium]
PLAFFSYKTALLLWLLVTIAPILFIIQRLYPGRNTLFFFLSFPATFQVFLHGQNGFLTATLLSGGMMLLNAHPFSGGILLGLLSYKPHLCILVVPALAAGKHWKALQGFFFSLFFFTTTTFWVYGFEPWQAFLNNIPIAAAILKAGALPFAKMPTPYAAIRLLGVQPASASLIQGISTLLCLLFVVLLWRSRAGYGIKAAGLIAATLLASPFGFDYDLVILFPAMTFLYSEFSGRQLFMRRLAVLSAAIWAIPLAGPIIASMTGFNIMPLVILALCVACGKCAKAG